VIPPTHASLPTLSTPWVTNTSIKAWKPAGR
jgi:hypothetical protein